MQTPEPVQSVTPVYVSAKIGARMFSLSSSSWYRHVADGRLPQPVRFGGSARWKLADVIAAFEAAAERDAA